ncbi:MAG: TaqI-like C-terminal specificity domain-containing protein [Vicingaceae bacterium]|nr:MAG: TaqI-like C-terminal specificity domain-containing protein [Vicingaceae bacterium]
MLDKISVIEKQPKDESEEHLKNNLRDFLRDTYYIESNAINTKDKKDLVIHIGKTTDTDVAVIIEAKRPSNKNEMVSADNANKKALHELILYYLTERNAKENVQLKQLVVTDINQWFIIDANYFDKHIYRNTQIRKLYETKVNDKKDNPWFYEEIAKIVSKIDVEIPCVYFDIRDYEKILRNTATNDDKELVALYKILSPQHLLKIATPNDSNTLNERFYKELLHIIGLEEAREGTKNVIRRKKENKNAASLIELTIEALKTEDTFHRIPDIKVYGENKEEQTFNIALELCITWINRILFLKLLEGQLISYHQGNKDYRFLNSATIHDYDELFKLFHKVLAVNIPDRTEAIKTKYSRVPYLNSSLFEISELEDQTIKINSLENDGQLELINTTILKEIKKKAATLPSLDYLFQFLDAYDFASEGTEDWQKDNKQLINASVLGKVFEKINGYRDGSIFTPAFITMYMCRQSIRLAVVEKFNETLSEKGKKLFDKFEDIKNYTSRHYKTEDVLKANEIINSLHICDPAVGSGHFLVSALNEIIAVKAELGILADDKGNNLSGYEIETVNDELIITDQQGNPIEYKLQNGKPISKEVQRLQKTLFHQKQTIIENCLFGVDINPKSVLICRLRLWIELLKNAYYKEAEYTELETLPNIDINIKCGNSLLSRFPLDADLTKALKSIKYDIKAYRGFVNDYKNEKSRDVKRGLQKIIDSIKSDFRTEIFNNDPKVVKLSKLSGDLYNLLNQGKLFELDSKEKKARKEKQQKLEADITKLSKEIEEIKTNALYKNAFEWRFEFPEVLNNKGEFEGFDLIIGNPPYVVVQSDLYLERFKTGKCYDLYCYFYELGKSLLKENLPLAFITPSLFIKGLKFKTLQDFLLKETSDLIIEDKGDNVFEGVAMPTAITFFRNKPNPNNVNWEDLFVTNPISKKMKSNNKLLGEISKIQRGLEIGKDKTLKTKTKFQLVTGEDIEKYNVKNIRFIDQKTYDEFIKGDLDYFKKERVLIRETGSSITCVYLDKLLLSNRSLYSIIPNKGISPKFVLAVLCSKLTQFFYQTEFKADTDVFPKIRIAQVKKIPIKVIPEKEQTPFINLVDKIISLKQQGKDSSEQEKKIDELVYKLYNITPDEQKIIEAN